MIFNPGPFGFSSVDQFKSETVALSKHFKNTNLSALRDAFSKYNGFDSVHAFLNFLEQLESGRKGRDFWYGVEPARRVNDNTFVRPDGKNGLVIQAPLPDELAEKFSTSKDLDSSEINADTSRAITSLFLGYPSVEEMDMPPQIFGSLSPKDIHTSIQIHYDFGRCLASLAVRYTKDENLIGFKIFCALLISDFHGRFPRAVSRTKPDVILVLTCESLRDDGPDGPVMKTLTDFRNQFQQQPEKYKHKDISVSLMLQCIKKNLLTPELQKEFQSLPVGTIALAQPYEVEEAKTKLKQSISGYDSLTEGQKLDLIEGRLFVKKTAFFMVAFLKQLDNFTHFLHKSDIDYEYLSVFYFDDLTDRMMRALPILTQAFVLNTPQRDL